MPATAVPAPPGGAELRRPSTLAAALADLAELGEAGAPLAGATWVMRERLWRKPLKRAYVSVAGLAELGGTVVGPEAVTIGAATTHAGLSVLGGPAAVLGQAAARSAFPAVRAVATVGGNLATVGFPEADLVPALLVAEASVAVTGPAGETTLPVAQYLSTREQRPAGELVVSITVPTPAGRRSGYARLTVRGGGEYAVASVAVSLDVADDGSVAAARMACGSVEPVARLSDAAAEALVGSRAAAGDGTRAGAAAAAQLTSRDGLDAPGSYRSAVLPALARRALAAAMTQETSP